MSDSDSSSDEIPTLPKSFRLRPSQKQKQRSKLGQAPDESPAPEPALETSKPAPPPLEPTVRRHRLKRSGQMHESLTAPIPDDDAPARPEPEY